ncbi:MAG: MCP four helix bundle domain-containing protein [Eubacterium sp.]|nr:MCP four helix bundle domain-containing protein [Eubacterium sp.]
MLKNEKIEKRLKRSFFVVSSITSMAALVAIIAVMVISGRYSYALNNYGFAQGDIGRAMFEFADLRSSLRAAIGYDDADAIAEVVSQHETIKEDFEKSLAQVEHTIVSKDGRATYDAILADLDEYWKLDTQIMELGATTDRVLCRQAQEIDLNDLAGVYNSIYERLEELLNVKVKEGNKLASTLSATKWVLAILIVIAIAAAMTLAMQIGRKIAKGIADPLKKLGERLETFAAGDLSGEFPQIDTGDEVEEMGKHVVHMADNLSAIIYDIEELLGEMAGGNYTVSSAITEKYTGDFEKMYGSVKGLRDQMTETLCAIGETSGQVNSGSNDVAAASQNLAEGATEQAGAVQQLHATISDITGTMQKSAQNADESYRKAQHYATEADNSREEMNTLMRAMERINDASTRIGDIISEIESIASQTNLLSLNASIEAARAGESGRGFAVVAAQIRELADQSAKAAVDTRKLIEGSVREVEQGNQAAERASVAISGVVDGIKQIADFSKNLKIMVEDQAEAMRQAEMGVNKISEVVQTNAATAQEASATSQELSSQSIVLDDLIGQFILKKGDTRENRLAADGAL